MTERPLDTLTEFHMQNPDDAVYALIAHLSAVLEDQNADNLEQTWRNINNILGEVEATRILHVMCRLTHVDYLTLMQNCQEITTRRISPRLLLHLSLLPVSFVAGKLQIDAYWAEQLLEEFHKHFTIDQPLVWLKSFLAITQQERLRHAKAKQDLLLGRAVTGTPGDTAEYRRHKNIFKPRLKPDDY